MLKSPFETGYICRSKAQFALALDKEHSIGVNRHHPFYKVCGTVGRAVVNNKNIERMLKRKERTYHTLNVFLLVISRNYNYRIAHFVFFCCPRAKLQVTKVKEK